MVRRAALVSGGSSGIAENPRSGIQFTAMLPGLVDTPMAAWTRNAGIAEEDMMPPSDLAEGLRFLLRTSTRCLVPQIEFVPPAQDEFIAKIIAFQAGLAAEPAGPAV